MSVFRPPSPGGPPDSEPAQQPSLPESALWADSDVGLPPAPLSTVAAQPAAGEPLATIGHIGRYGLKYRIGEGGLGTVYAAHDPLLSRLIAIKTLNVELAAEERAAFNALFLNEARAAGGLSHPNIVTVFDAGVSDNSAYIAMELLKGRDLRQLRQEGWRPTPAQAALIARRVADALAYAHAKGVVHCDIKPANIFMVGRTQPRVLDFGIARIAHRHDASADLAAGSPYYMAPEQVRQHAVDRRADVFSLGVVLYEMLADVRPFRGSSLEEITNAVLEHEPPLASTVDPNVPVALAEIVARAIEKDPDHRWRSARALSRELRHWLEEHASAPVPVPGADEPAGGSAGARRRRWLAVAASSLALVAAAAFWLGRPPAVPAAGPLVVANDTPLTLPATTAGAPPTTAGPVTPAPGAVPPASPTAGADPAATEKTATAGTAAATPAPPAAAPAVAAPAVAAAAPPVVEPPPAAATTPPRAAANPDRPAARATAAREAPPETARERRLRETRDARATLGANSGAATATGTVRIAVTPWAQVEVDGAPAGTSPPLTELQLSEGRHRITLRNADFPPHSITVNVTAGQPVTLRHQFGS